jgi:hypothetical protein
MSRQPIEFTPLSEGIGTGVVILVTVLVVSLVFRGDSFGEALIDASVLGLIGGAGFALLRRIRAGSSRSAQ